MKADLIKYISKINEKPSAQGKLLEQFISHGASTIPEISKAIGVSLPTTTSALNELIKEGLAREIGKKDNSSGRIPMVYDLVPTAGYFIGVNPEMNCLALAASDFAGNLITEKTRVPYVYENSPENLEEIKRKPYRRVSNIAAIRFSFSFLNLFVPSLKKPDVDGNISCNFTFAFPEICHIRYRRKIRFFFRQFQRDPVIGGVNGIFQRLVEGIPFCIAAGEIWKITFVGSLFGFMKNGWISKFHSVSSFFLFFFTEILFYRSTFSQKIQCLKYN